MHTIIGFIQYLLMLTQSRLMPDLHGLFDQRTTVEKHWFIPQGYRAFTVDRRDTHSWVLFSDEKDKPSPRLLYARPERHVYLRNLQKKSLLCICKKKRYLVFCQLKTEG